MTHSFYCVFYCYSPPLKLYLFHFLFLYRRFIHGLFSRISVFLYTFPLSFNGKHTLHPFPNIRTIKLRSASVREESAVIGTRDEVGICWY